MAAFEKEPNEPTNPLKKFVEEIREKKRTSGKRLPPKSKPIGGYLKNISHSKIKSIGRY